MQFFKIFWKMLNNIYPYYWQMIEWDLSTKFHISKGSLSSYKNKRHTSAMTHGTSFTPSIHVPNIPTIYRRICLILMRISMLSSVCDPFTTTSTRKIWLRDDLKHTLSLDASLVLYACGIDKQEWHTRVSRRCVTQESHAGVSSNSKWI